MLINIELDRDSVCMGDDIEDHSKSLCIDAHGDMASVILSVAENYLPTIAGRGHHWICNVDGVKVAIIYGNCKTIELTVNDTVKMFDGSNVSFGYISSTY